MGLVVVGLPSGVRVGCSSIGVAVGLDVLVLELVAGLDVLGVEDVAALALAAAAG